MKKGNISRHCTTGLKVGSQHRIKIVLLLRQWKVLKIDCAWVSKHAHTRGVEENLVL